MSATPNLGLPYIDAGQAQKHVTHNEALRYLDALVQLAVQDRDLTTPPSSPAEGQRWIVKTGATDAWSGHADHIAAWQDGAWQFSAPIAGWVAYVIDEEILAAWDGSAWTGISAGSGGSDPTELQDMTLLGIGTTADTANPLSAKLNNVLWTAKTVAEGGDGTLRYKLSKESAANTLSFLLQDNFVGCAEIGLTGDDDFHFKVSPDGTAWLEAIKIDRATGKVSFPVSGGPREVLSANRTYYVRTDGNDSNNGLANTAGGAFLTLQAAWNAILKLDLGGFSVTVQIADGTYTAGLMISSPAIGGNVTFQGNHTTPANVLVSTSGPCVYNSASGFILNLRDFKIASSGSVGVNGAAGAYISIGGMDFGACGNTQLRADSGSYISIDGNYTISGGGPQHWAAIMGGKINGNTKTITLTGAPAFSSAFAAMETGAVLNFFSPTFSGSAAGARYSISSGGIINLYGAGTSALPGDSAGSGGTASGGGFYS